MEDFTPKSLCVLGRQPQLGLAELESLYGAKQVRPFGGCALLNIEASEINFKRLGGTVKIAKILSKELGNDWLEIEDYLLTNIPAQLQNIPQGKLTLGVSAYGLNITAAEINKSLLKVKKLVKASDRPVRVVPNKETALSSAQVLHNKLIHRGGWELVVAQYNKQTLLAQTLFVQDIAGYGARDQVRPARDARVGMLPPKLAQIMVNLAAGQLVKGTDSQKVRLLDPFCGTGVVLQEAMLMDYHVLGTDLEPRMVDYTKKNLSWLVQKYPRLDSLVSIEQADATSAQWPTFSMVVSETYLGRPLNALPSPDKLKEIVSDVNTIIIKFLKNLQSQIKPGRPVCLAVPAWLGPAQKVTKLPLIDQISNLGYNKAEFKHVGTSELLYFRPGQVVARQLLVLTKR